MTLIELILLSIWLSMDVFAVCMSDSMSYTWFSKNEKLKTTLTFWFFHFAMLTIGFFVWNFFMHYISKYDHRIALILLLYVWWEMTFDFIKEYREYKKNKWKTQIQKKEFSTKTLLIQWLAVSIDAIAVWLSLSAINVNIWTSAICVYVISMIFCILWFFLWKKLWLILKHRSQLIWGLILIWIWIKIFLEHMM